MGCTPMNENDTAGKTIDAVAHDLAQQLQVIAMVLAAIERREGDLHASEIEAARHALEILDRSLEALIALARRD
jgi:hypothetical protein